MNHVKPHSLFTDFDISLFQSGKHYRLYEKFGAHPAEVDGVKGMYFSVFAPAAKSVYLVGDFNNWIGTEHQLLVRWDSSGIWEGFVEGMTDETLYKYQILTYVNQVFEKSDPYARHCETPPATASIIWDKTFKWSDGKWMKSRKNKNKIGKPISAYEVHLESWRRHGEEKHHMSYRQLAVELTDYVKEMGFTHVELMPIMEYPYDASWGYQITGFFAPTSRFGTPEDFKYLINTLHKNDIGVILDWVPSHFPSDAHGLGNFDGSCVYEHPDLRKGYHPDWKSLIFNFGRNEVKSFLISNALFWLEEYHIDGLRVDAVASMIYLDYSRDEGGWEPNEFGGRENLEAIAFLKEFNEATYKHFPDTITIAEESTAFPAVSKPTYDGGLGFGMKWMMGWMHDTLNYFKVDPLFRKFHHNRITFSMIYAYSENYMLPLSHDEVVHGKGSLLSRMPGDGPTQFANLRVLLSYMFTHPGAKLLFMGGEIGQRSEWNFRGSVEWDLLEYESHKGVQNLTKALNRLYVEEPALHELCTQPEGFDWINIDDWENSVMCYLRKGKKANETLLVALNFLPVAQDDYRIGIIPSKKWSCIFNSDDAEYWGNGDGKKLKPLTVRKKKSHNQSQSLVMKLSPLSVTIWKQQPPVK